MANLLNFSEAEKEKVHIDKVTGALGKVVGTVMAPSPPPKADVDSGILGDCCGSDSGMAFSSCSCHGNNSRHQPSKQTDDDNRSK